MNFLNTKHKGILINSDCLFVMERLKDRSIDLVYLDPPWDTGVDFAGNTDLKNADYEEFIFYVLQQAKRLLKRNGNLILHSVSTLNINFHNLIGQIF